MVNSPLDYASNSLNFFLFDLERKHYIISAGIELQ